MNQVFTARLAGGCLLITASGPVAAHVILESPNGGEIIESGSMFIIQWRVLIQHDTLNWDLLLSTESVSGTYVPIALDLPVGDGSTGSIHTYEWTVPDINADQAWVRIIQDNSATDYQDSSNQPFAIVPSPGGWTGIACLGLVGTRRRR